MKIHHLCITTQCYKESLAFYLNVMGFNMVKESKDFHGRGFNTWLKGHNIMIELQTKKENENVCKFNIHSEGIVHMAFITDNIEDEYRKIKKMDYNKFVMKNGVEIYSVNGQKLFKVIAPEGTIIEIRDSEVQ